MLWVAGIAVGLLALLAVPVDVAFAACRRERFEARLTIRWLWGWVPLPAPQGGRRKPRSAKPKRARRRKPGKPSGVRRALAMVRSEDFPRRVLRLLRDLLRSVHVRRFDFDLRVGLDDPADTGRLWGLIGPVTALLTLPSPARIVVTPEFAEPLLHLDAHAEARIVPAGLLAVLIVFLLSPPTLRALCAAVRGTP